MRTRIKICGLTRVEDALCAARLGADALGLVFYSASPRFVTIEQSVEIIKQLPPFITIVALFVNEQEKTIRNVLGKVSIDLLQFHGDESAQFCRIFNKPYVKAVRMQKDTDLSCLANEYHDASGLLLDAYHADMKGGTGQQFDWDIIPESCALPIILAGGLEPANVKQAIKKVRPFALDVSSGVEISEGVKDESKMTAFVNEVYHSDRK